MAKEFTGKNINEAVKKGLKELNLEKKDVKIKILDKGKKGLFGLKSVEPARIVIIKQKAGLNMETAKNKAVKVTEWILKKITDDVKVKGRYSRDKVSLLIGSGNKSIIIGRQGKNLQALEYIVNLILRRDPATRTQVKIDIDGNREKKRHNSSRKNNYASGEKEKT